MKKIIIMGAVLIAAGFAAYAQQEVQPLPSTSPLPITENPDDTFKASYLSCGCGCCGGIDPDSRKPTCVKDQAALEAIILKDEETAKLVDCAMIGCSFGTLYEICE